MPTHTQVGPYLWRIEHRNSVYWALSMTEVGIIKLRLLANQPSE